MFFTIKGSGDNPVIKNVNVRAGGEALFLRSRDQWPLVHAFRELECPYSTFPPWGGEGSSCQMSVNCCQMTSNVPQMYLKSFTVFFDCFLQGIKDLRCMMVTWFYCIFAVLFVCFLQGIKDLRCLMVTTFEDLQHINLHFLETLEISHN